MTAADVAMIRHLDLPLLASGNRVRVFEDLEVDRLESCEQCVIRSYKENWPEGREIPVGRMRLTYHLREGGAEHRTDLCGADCSDVELDDLLNLPNCVGVRLHVQPPSKFLPSGNAPDPGAATGEQAAA